MTSAPAVGVVFVNYRSESLIAPRVARLQDAGFKVAVIDNSGSASESLPVAARPGNVGFGTACNLGVAALDSTVEVICLHNPDVDADPATILELARTVHHQAHPGAAAPAERTGRVVRSRGYHYPKAWREAILGLRPVGKAHDERVKRQASLDLGQPAPHEPRTVVLRGTGDRFASAALLLVDRAAWEALGGFDERYFMYYEDLDLWHRLARSGRDCVFRSELTVNHHFSAGSPTNVAARELFRWLGVELFCQKFEPGRWPAMRRVHRALMRVHSRRSPKLAGAIIERWDSGLDPAQTLDSLRPGLEAGTWA